MSAVHMISMICDSMIGEMTACKVTSSAHVGMVSWYGIHAHLIGRKCFGIVCSERWRMYTVHTLQRRLISTVRTAGGPHVVCGVLCEVRYVACASDIYYYPACENQHTLYISISIYDNCMPQGVLETLASHSYDVVQVHLFSCACFAGSPQP